MSGCLSICLSVCIAICLSASASPCACLSVCLSVRLSCLSVRPPAFLSICHLSICMSFCLSCSQPVRLSLSPPGCEGDLPVAEGVPVGAVHGELHQLWLRRSHHQQDDSRGSAHSDPQCHVVALPPAVESRPELAPRGPPSRRWTKADCWTEWNMINITVMV